MYIYLYNKRCRIVVQKKKVICAKNRIFLYIDFFFYCVMFLTVFHTTVFLSFFLLNVDFSKLKTRYLLLQMAKMMNYIFDKTEKVVRKEENAGY